MSGAFSLNTKKRPAACAAGRSRLLRPEGSGADKDGVVERQFLDLLDERWGDVGLNLSSFDVSIADVDALRYEVTHDLVEVAGTAGVDIHFHVLPLASGLSADLFGCPECYRPEENDPEEDELESAEEPGKDAKHRECFPESFWLGDGEDRKHDPDRNESDDKHHCLRADFLNE